MLRRQMADGSERMSRKQETERMHEANVATKTKPTKSEVESYQRKKKNESNRMPIICEIGSIDRASSSAVTAHHALNWATSGPSRYRRRAPLLLPRAHGVPPMQRAGPRSRRLLQEIDRRRDRMDSVRAPPTCFGRSRADFLVGYILKGIQTIPRPGQRSPTHVPTPRAIDRLTD